MKISTLKAYEILDSRGNPTVACRVILTDGSVGLSMVPSGASTGQAECLELRDKDSNRYHGLGVLKAVTNVNEKIQPIIFGHDAANQSEIDQLMIDLDGTPNKSNLGANAILSVSLAIARAEANSEKKELFEYLTKFNPDFDGLYHLPMPQMNVINGGKHANWATDIQEYMLIPVSAASLPDAIRMGAEVYQALKTVLINHKYSISVGDEGGFAPLVSTNEEPLKLLTEAINSVNYALEKDFVFGIDAAASEFFENNIYDLKRENKKVDTQGLISYYENLIALYPIVNLEDIFSQDDWLGFSVFTGKYGSNKQIVGDDLYATNVHLLNRGIQEKSSNAILIKVNQIGTLTETINSILLARQHNMNSIVSHRSGETEDTFIADLVVAMGTGQIKTGSLARSERVSKYNRLIDIAYQTGDKGCFTKPNFGSGINLT
jgi:enolase